MTRKVPAAAVERTVPSLAVNATLACGVEVVVLQVIVAMPPASRTVGTT
jgi:hypothetical protein